MAMARGLAAYRTVTGFRTDRSIEPFKTIGYLSTKSRQEINWLQPDLVTIVLHFGEDGLDFPVTWLKRGLVRGCGRNAACCAALLHWREEGTMSDGREERNEREKRKELEEREDREDRIERELADPWEPERHES